MNTIHIAWTGSGFNVHVWFHLTNKQNIKKNCKNNIDFDQNRCGIVAKTTLILSKLMLYCTILTTYLHRFWE